MLPKLIEVFNLRSLPHSLNRHVGKAVLWESLVAFSS